ncbi:MAG: EFR1 family ferrodoxin [Spirochaetales bacterium]
MSTSGNSPPGAGPRLAVYYWTGTGNTARAVGVVVRELQQAGWEVGATLVRHDTPVPSPTELAGLEHLLLACPTLGFSAPASFLAWLGRWPKANGPLASRPVASVLAVCGAELWRGRVLAGHSGGLRRQVARRLAVKGLRVARATDVSYPANWTQFFRPTLPPQVGALLELGDAGALAFARALASATPVPDRRSRWLSLPLNAVGVLFRSLARRFLARLYTADPACTACGLCARDCPVGAIRMTATANSPGSLPAWSLRCDACNRCINLCPAAAIQTSWFRLVIHGSLQLAATVGAVVALWWWGPVLPWVFWLLFTTLQLTWLDSALVWLERRRRFRRLLTRGPTQNWGRYRAPGSSGVTLQE